MPQYGWVFFVKGVSLGHLHNITHSDSVGQTLYANADALSPGLGVLLLIF